MFYYLFYLDNTNVGARPHVQRSGVDPLVKPGTGSYCGALIGLLKAMDVGFRAECGWQRGKG